MGLQREGEIDAIILGVQFLLAAVVVCSSCSKRLTSQSSKGQAFSCTAVGKPVSRPASSLTQLSRSGQRFALGLALRVGESAFCRKEKSLLKSSQQSWDCMMYEARLAIVDSASS